MAQDGAGFQTVTSRAPLRARRSGYRIDTGPATIPYAAIGAIRPIGLRSNAPMPNCLQGNRAVSLPPYCRHLTTMLALCVSLTACGWFLPPPQTRGNRVEKEQLKELVPGNSVRTLDGLDVSTFEMDHTIPCIGYRLEGGKGKVISYSGDTQPCDGVALLARNANLLIHEATYLQREVEKARPPKHTTVKEAAGIASTAEAKNLILTHVNESHETPEQMLAEATPVFEKTSVAYDGLEFVL